ncbi:MAG: hypothetical protein HQ579_03120, partial [Candidatus Omnitrophica bacterium]|nr:hypothetical protein [Candidatus Omnitrophota bacterium]
SKEIDPEAIKMLIEWREYGRPVVLASGREFKWTGGGRGEGIDFETELLRIHRYIDENESLRTKKDEILSGLYVMSENGLCIYDGKGDRLKKAEDKVFSELGITISETENKRLTDLFANLDLKEYGFRENEVSTWEKERSFTFIMDEVQDRVPAFAEQLRERFKDERGIRILEFDKGVDITFYPADKSACYVFLEKILGIESDEKGNIIFTDDSCQKGGNGNPAAAGRIGGLSTDKFDPYDNRMIALSLISGQTPGLRTLLWAMRPLLDRARGRREAAIAELQERISTADSTEAFSEIIQSGFRHITSGNITVEAYTDALLRLADEYPRATSAIAGGLAELLYEHATKKQRRTHSFTRYISMFALAILSIGALLTLHYFGVDVPILTPGVRMVDVVQAGGCGMGFVGAMMALGAAMKAGAEEDEATTEVNTETEPSRSKFAKYPDEILLRVIKQDLKAKIELVKIGEKFYIKKTAGQALGFRTLARWLLKRRYNALKLLQGINGIPVLFGGFGHEDSTFYCEFVEGALLKDVQDVRDDFFDSLLDIARSMWNVGVAYGDLGNRGNILVGKGGQPYLIDFETAVFRRGNIFSKWLFQKFRQEDLYHLYKLKLAYKPELTTSEEERIGATSSFLRIGYILLYVKPRNLIRAIIRNIFFASEEPMVGPPSNTSELTSAPVVSPEEDRGTREVRDRFDSEYEPGSSKEAEPAPRTKTIIEVSKKATLSFRMHALP